VSQGIDSVIVPREEDHVWLLEIAETDLPRATESIRAYERENATVWRREVKGTGMLFDARAVFWFAALILFHFFAARSAIDFQIHGLMDRGSVLHGEWWRIFTATTLHGDVAHLATNAVTGIVFLGLAMGVCGPGLALLLSFLGGALGNVATLLLHDTPFRSLGASGFVMASLGLLAAQSIAFAPNDKRFVKIGRGLMAGVLLVVLLGFSPKSDVIAHVGGFIAGIVLGMTTLRLRPLLMNRPFNVSCVAICVGLVILTWALALR
jgi:membrane associated rhomboid family serine protease